MLVLPEKTASKFNLESSGRRMKVKPHSRKDFGVFVFMEVVFLTRQFI